MLARLCRHIALGFNNHAGLGLGLKIIRAIAFPQKARNNVMKILNKSI